MSTWIITGGSAGLGREIIAAALAAGHNVVGTARNTASLADFAAGFPDRFLAQAIDVNDAAAARAAAEAARARFGAIDVLVSNAGFSGVGSIEDMPDALIEAQFATNFMGTVNVVRAVLPTMRAQGSGRILVVSSIGARIATAGAGFYYATKAAVSSLAATLALEVAPFGIRVTAVEPGAMRTRFADAASLRVAPFDPAYDETVGATIRFMQSQDFHEVGHEPAGHAAMIVALAELPDPPVRLLAGADAQAYAEAADGALRESDARWATLSASASLAAEPSYRSVAE